MEHGNGCVVQSALFERTMGVTSSYKALVLHTLQRRWVHSKQTCAYTTYCLAALSRMSGTCMVIACAEGMCDAYVSAKKNINIKKNMNINIRHMCPCFPLRVPWNVVFNIKKSHHPTICTKLNGCCLALHEPQKSDHSFTSKQARIVQNLLGVQAPLCISSPCLRTILKSKNWKPWSYTVMICKHMIGSPCPPCTKKLNVFGKVVRTILQHHSNDSITRIS